MMSNRYPTIICHGLAGWGENDKLNAHIPHFGLYPSKGIPKHLREAGFEVYQPSLGPVSSAWDRSCELWAQLFGGTVDYGKVHSEKYGHARYGRTYEKGLIPDWGTPGDHAKINVLGHSFGGPTVKQFADLVANGCQEEIDGTPEEELSGLFKKDKPQKLHGVGTLSGVNNGTTLASLMGYIGMTFATYYFLVANAIFSQTRVMQYYDFHTDHWGIMQDPATVTEHKFTNPWKKRACFAAYNRNRVDSCAYEMQVETVQDLVNPEQKINPNTYYFAYRADRTHENEKGKRIPNKSMCALCKIAGIFTGNLLKEKKLSKYGVSKSWQANDGFVNVIGQSAPLNQPYTDYVRDTEVKPGIWYNMPVEDKDHLSWIGLGESKDKFFSDYEIMLNRFAQLPDAETLE